MAASLQSRVCHAHGGAGSSPTIRERFVITGIVCGCTIFAGLVGQHVQQGIAVVTGTWLGCSLLISLGLWSLIQGLLWRRGTATSTFEVAVTEFDRFMFLVLAESLAALAVGFGSGLLHFDVFIVALSMLLFRWLGAND